MELGLGPLWRRHAQMELSVRSSESGAGIRPRRKQCQQLGLYFREGSLCLVLGVEQPQTGATCAAGTCHVAGATLIGTESKQRRKSPSSSNPHTPCGTPGTPDRQSLTRSQLEKEDMVCRGSAPASEVDCGGGEEGAENSGSITSEPPATRPWKYGQL